MVSAIGSFILVTAIQDASSVPLRQSGVGCVALKMFISEIRGKDTRWKSRCRSLGLEDKLEHSQHVHGNRKFKIQRMVAIAGIM